MSIKSNLLAGASPIIVGPMSANERAHGRYLRDETGHAPAPAPAPTPAPTPAAEAAPAAEAEDLGDGALDGFFDPNEVSGDVEPATPKADDPPEGEEDGEHGPVTDEPKDKDKGQSAEERIGEITAARREAERQASEAQREAAELRARIEALEKPKGPEGKVVDPDAEPDPADYEFGEADPEFTRDLTRFTARQEFQLQESQARLKGELATLDGKWQTNIGDAALQTEYPDFNEKVVVGGEKNAWACPPLIALGIKDSAEGPHIAYHLATNVEESRRIAALSPIEQAREFGRLEGKFEAKRAAKANPEPKPVTTTKAPEPPQARTRGAGGKFGVEADTEDFASFSKMADAVLAKK